jgi:chromosomal replication initiator protein
MKMVGTMANGGMANMAVQPVGALWGKACQELKRELGDDTFGSWLAQAAVREGPGGALVHRAKPPPPACGAQ